MSFDPHSFVVTEARPLPLILLLDASGSMQGEKIATLNAAVRELGEDLARAETPQGEVHLAVIVFNHNVVTRPLVPARQFIFEPLVAEGQTCMGAAVAAAMALIEDKQQLGPRAYAPTLVLVSDGQPTDDLGRPLDRLLGSSRGQKATRLALAIGQDADLGCLQRFVANPELPVIRAHEVARIRSFFRWVSLSMQARSKSRNPNQPALAPLTDFSEADILF